ncbi:MAG: LOG family protein [Bdellovibrionales bacterium]|nr:LOG family protein [Bdellovibrionales bacterium]
MTEVTHTGSIGPQDHSSSVSVNRAEPVASLPVASTRQELHEALTHAVHLLPEIRRSAFGHNDPLIIRCIDADYKSQVVHDAVRAGEKAWSKALEEGASQEDAVASAYSAAIHTTHKDAHLYADFLRRAQGKKVLTNFGTARTNVVEENPELESFKREVLAPKCVKAGISIGNGGAISGDMGLGTDAWQESIDAAISQGNPGAEIFLTPLRIASSREDTIENVNPYCHIAPELETMLSRTTGLYAAGNTAACIVSPGGRGTEEEALRGIAEAVAKITRGTDSFHTNGKPSHMHFVGVDGSWENLQNLLRQMEEVGTIPPGVLDTFVTFWDLSRDDHGTIADAVVACFEENENQGPKVNPLAVYDEYLVALNDKLNNDDQFSLPRVTVDDPGYWRGLDSQYAVCVRRDAEEHFLKLVSDDGLEPSEALKRSLEKARKWRNSLNDLREKCKDDYTVTIIGTDAEVWNEDLQRATEHLVHDCVQEGYSLVVRGDRTKGVTKHVFDAWYAAKKDHPDSTSKLIRVQSRADGERVPKFTNGSSEAIREDLVEFLAPPIRTLVLQAPLQIGLGKSLGVVVYPVGSSGLSEVAGAALSSQLASIVETTYSHGGDRAVTYNGTRGAFHMPEVFYFNPSVQSLCPTLSNVQGFFDPLIAQFEADVDLGTADPGDHRGKHHLLPVDNNPMPAVSQILYELSEAAKKRDQELSFV